MAFFRLNPILWWWRRRRVERALRLASRTGSPDAAKSALLTALRGCPLLVAVRDVPRSPPTDASGKLTEDLPLKMLTGRGPAGKVLFAFTSKKQLRLVHPTAGGLFMFAASVAASAKSMAPEVVGVVLNPGSEFAFLSHSELAGFTMRYAEFQRRIEQMAAAASPEARRRFALDTIRLLQRSAEAAIQSELSAEETRLHSMLIAGLEAEPLSVGPIIDTHSIGLIDELPSR
jgi:hypothetical protein